MSSKLPYDPREHEHFGEIMKQMNQFFHQKPVRGFLQSIDDFFRSPFPHLSFPIDVSENEREHIIQAQLAGVTRDQIQIDVLGNAITITVNNREELTEEDDNKQLYRKRQTLSRSSRTISLPFPINEKAVKATYKNGLLDIRVHKKKGRIITIDSE
jgi:HSP20 family protein